MAEQRSGRRRLDRVLAPGFLEGLALLKCLCGAPALGFVARLVALAELFLGRAQAVELGTKALQVGAECRSRRFRDSR